MIDQQTKYLIVIAGPTASGKTAIAVKLAHQLGSVILSADARQFYREIPIGTAAPDAAMRAGAVHHFVGQLSIHDHFDAGSFEQAALELLEEIFREDQFAILCGGSGMFIRAVTDGLDALPAVPPSVREKVRSLYSEHGLTGLQNALQILDPAYYQIVDQKNPQRLMRALEVCIAGGGTYSEYRQGNTAPRKFKSIKICLDVDRAQLYSSIDARVDAMIANGLIDEAKSVYAHRHLPALQTVGYKELFSYFDGNCDLETAIKNIRQHTRNYAKRQLTWFRNTGGYHMVAPGLIDKNLIMQLIAKTENEK